MINKQHSLDLSGLVIDIADSPTESDEMNEAQIENLSNVLRRLSTIPDLSGRVHPNLQSIVEEITTKEYSFESIENSIDNLDYYMYYSYMTIFPIESHIYNESNNIIASRLCLFGVKGGLRMLLCIFIQTIITPIMIYYSFNQNTNMCLQKSSIVQKITAAIFTLYINISSINSLADQLNIYLSFNSFFILYHKFQHKHYNRQNKYKRKFFNILVNFFLSINIISCVLTTVGSVIIIYNSDTILEIILNSLALKFIDEIDNMSISKTEIATFKYNYNIVKNNIEKNSEFFKAYVPKRVSQYVKLFKKMCVMIFLGCILSILLYIFTIIAEIWIIFCY